MSSRIETLMTYDESEYKYSKNSTTNIREAGMDIGKDIKDKDVEVTDGNIWERCPIKMTKCGKMRIVHISMGYPMNVYQGYASNGNNEAFVIPEEDRPTVSIDSVGGVFYTDGVLLTPIFCPIRVFIENFSGKIGIQRITEDGLYEDLTNSQSNLFFEIVYFTA